MLRLGRGREKHGAKEEDEALQPWFPQPSTSLVKALVPGTTLPMRWQTMMAAVAAEMEMGTPLPKVMMGKVQSMWMGPVPGAKFARMQMMPELMKVSTTVMEAMEPRGLAWVTLAAKEMVMAMKNEWMAEFTKDSAEMTGTVPMMMHQSFAGVRAPIEQLDEIKVTGMTVAMVTGPAAVEAMTPRMKEAWMM